VIRIVAWTIAACILALSLAVLYYWAPAWEERHWRWLTPGTAVGVIGWLLASLGFRVYIHYFNNYTVTYGSLGAVIILLMWFYISGLMLLLGAEIDTVVDAAAEKRPREISRAQS
jgi:membrane protein